MVISSDDPEQYLKNLEADIEWHKSQIKAYEKQIEKLEKEEKDATEEGIKARDLINQKTIEELKESVGNVSKSSKIAAEEAFELEKWGATAFKIAEDPENSPFKLMLKTLNKGFSYLTYEDRVTTADTIFLGWVDSLNGKQTKEQQKREREIKEMFLGPEKVVVIAEAFPQYFNQFQYQGDQSKQIETWYSPESWKGVGEAYYQECAWRRSVLLNLSQTLVSLEWKLFKNQNYPNETLPNEKILENMRSALAKLVLDKEKLEKQLEEYETKLEKYKQSLSKPGVDQDTVDETATRLTVQVIESEKRAIEENRQNQSTNAVDSTLRTSIDINRHESAPPTTNRQNFTESKERIAHGSALGTFDAYTKKPSLVLGPFWGAILSQIKRDAPEQDISEEELLRSYPEYALLSNDELVRVNEYMKKGNSLQEAMKFALQIKGMPPEFEHLSTEEKEQVRDLIRKGTSPNLALKQILTLQIKGMPPEFELLTDAEKAQVGDLIRKGIAPSDAIRQILTINQASGSASQKSENSLSKEPRGVAVPTPASAKSSEEKKPDSHEKNPQFIKDMARMEKSRGQSEGNVVSRGWRDALNQIRNAQIFRSVQNQTQTSQQTPTRVNQSLGAALGTLGKGVNKVASKALDLAAKAAGPVGVALKKLYDLIPEEWKKTLKELLLGGVSGLYILVSKLLSSIFGGATTLLGGGSAVAASAVVLPAGSALAGSSAAGTTSFFGGSGGGIIGGGGGGGLSGFGGFMTANAPAVACVGVGCATLVTVVTTAAAFSVPGEASEKYEDPKFTITKEIESVKVNGANIPFANNQIPNVGDQPSEVTYKITFTSEGEPIILLPPTDKPVSYKSTRDPIPLDVPSGIDFPSSLSANESKSVTLTVLLPGSQAKNYDDSRLVNTITVVGTVNKEEKPTSQTQTASVSLKIGNPIDGPPYGFPVAGPIRSLDYDVIKGGGCKGRNGVPNNTHCGSFVGGEVIFGGIDISALGEVKSTIDGIVAESSFDNKVGGKIVIISESGQYQVLFLHLKDPTETIVKGQQISRNQKIGEIYPGKLINTSGAHIHYQILKDGQNLPFATAPAGECLVTGENIMTTAQKEIINERVTNHTDPTITAGPWDTKCL